MVHKQPSPSGCALGLGWFMDHKSLSTVVYLLRILSVVQDVPLRRLVYSTMLSIDGEFFSQYQALAVDVL